MCAGEDVYRVDLNRAEPGGGGPDVRRSGARGLLRTESERAECEATCLGQRQIGHCAAAARLTRSRSRSISACDQYFPSATTPPIARVFAIFSSGLARRITRSAM